MWRRGEPATVRELVDEDCANLAYTTVMTTLDRLFKKNILTRQPHGRAFRYAPRFSREELHQQALVETLRQALDASPTPVLPLSHLVESLSERDVQLLDDLQQLVAAKRRELGAQSGNNGAGESSSGQKNDKGKA